MRMGLCMEREKVGYINFLTRITPDYDCVPWTDVSIVPDIGILTSIDPVAIDSASYDLVNQQTGFTDSRLMSHHHKGEDKFSGVRANTAGKKRSDTQNHWVWDPAATN